MSIVVDFWSVDKDHELQKGEQFGFFQFGGSDIITLYQECADVRFDEFPEPGEAKEPYVSSKQGATVNAFAVCAVRWIVRRVSSVRRIQSFGTSYNVLF